MAELPVETGKPNRSRRAAAIAAGALFPLLVGVGVFAPGLVQLVLQTGGPAGQTVLREGPPSPFERRPLPAPRDPAIGFTPVALELDRLFFETEFRGSELAPDGGAMNAGAGAGPTPAEIAQLLSFPRHETDALVLDELGAPEQQVVFKDALIPEQLAALDIPDQGDLFLPLCSTIPATNCLRFDDFTRVDPSVPIPEPASFGLLAAGVALLAAAHRRR